MTPQAQGSGWDAAEKGTGFGVRPKRGLRRCGIFVNRFHFCFRFLATFCGAIKQYHGGFSRLWVGVQAKPDVREAKPDRTEAKPRRRQAKVQGGGSKRRIFTALL